MSPMTASVKGSADPVLIGFPTLSDGCCAGLTGVSVLHATAAIQVNRERETTAACLGIGPRPMEWKGAILQRFCNCRITTRSSTRHEELGAERFIRRSRGVHAPFIRRSA